MTNTYKLQKIANYFPHPVSNNFFKNCKFQTQIAIAINCNLQLIAIIIAQFTTLKNFQVGGVHTWNSARSAKALDVLDEVNGSRNEMMNVRRDVRGKVSNSISTFPSKILGNRDFFSWFLVLSFTRGIVGGS